MPQDFSKRFQLMTETLKRNPRVKITQLSFKEPASPADIARVKQRINGLLPAGVEDFYRERNGFNLGWESVLSTPQESELVGGSVNLLPLLDIFKDWKGAIWFDNFEGGESYKPVKPFDFFVPEACAAFYQPNGAPPEQTAYYHFLGESLENTHYTFLEYIERLLISRGYWYWIQTLCKSMQGSSEVSSFRRNMPLLFEDYQDGLFYPKMGH